MPVQTGSRRQAGGSGGGGGERLPLLEREIGRLRRELEALKSQGGSGASAGLAGWMTTALAALGTLLGLMALRRH
jgi:hypothetical protein